MSRRKYRSAEGADVFQTLVQEMHMARSEDHFETLVKAGAVFADVFDEGENWQWFTLSPGGTKAFNAKLMGS